MLTQNKKKTLLCPTIEHRKYNQSLHQLTLFPLLNIKTRTKLKCIVISFRFKTIIFNKKKTLPFFLALELLTSQKCVASLATKNIQTWKIRKGRLIGCKVTLRKDNLYNFLNTLYFTCSRIENYKPYINFMDKIYAKSFKEQPAFIFTLKELNFFEIIDLCLGLQPTRKQLIVHLMFSSFYKEDCYFILRYSKILVI